MTISNLSGEIPIAEYVDNVSYYHSFTIQLDRYSESDVMISFKDNK